MTFVQNVWYPAAWADEVGPETLLARTIAGIPVVMFRTEQAGATALLDRCPHRFAPLSKGRKQADGVACGYHGLAFNDDREGASGCAGAASRICLKLNAK
jgi:vanillate O-demethylase monooxygenase subunit